MLIASVSRTIALEESLGMDAGLKQTAEFVERLIARINSIAPVDDSTLDGLSAAWRPLARVRAGRSSPGCANARPVGGRSGKEG